MSYFKGNQYVRNRIKCWFIRVAKRIANFLAPICKKSMKWGAIASIYGWSCVGAYHYAVYTTPAKIVRAEVKVEVPSKEIPPILKEIMKCESKQKQKGKSGQITYNVNKDGSLDLGVMQINSVHFATATRLGYDLTKEEDNIAFGLYLFNTQGTEPWYSSKSCWKK